MQQLAGITESINESVTKTDVLKAIQVLRKERTDRDELTRGEIVEYLDGKVSFDKNTIFSKVTNLVDQLVDDGKVEYSKQGIILK